MNKAAENGRGGATLPSRTAKMSLWKAGARMRLMENAIMTLPGVLQTIALICVVLLILAPLVGVSLSGRR
jgi:hypothetical protein